MHTATHGNDSATHIVPKPHAHEYLSFRLGAEEFGIDILKVQEIRAYEPPTRVANAPAFVKGLMNLRGAIVPVVDLRLRFGLKAPEYGAFTVNIVVNLSGRVVALVVDSVSEVVAPTPEQLRDATAHGSVVDDAHVLAQAWVEERSILLLDIESLVLSPGMAIAD